MTTTICFTVPSVRVITRALASDWGPWLGRAAGAIAAVLAVAYTAGLCAGLLVRQLTAWVERHHLDGLARMGLPGASIRNSEVWGVTRPIIQRQAPAPLPVLSRRDACRQLRAQGLSPARIGKALGISRTTVRRELAT